MPTIKSRKQLQDLLDYQKSKTKWYMDENCELRKLAKKQDAVLAKLDSRISELEAEIAELKGGIRKRWVKVTKEARYKSKLRTRAVRKERQGMREYKEGVVNEIAYLTKDFDWDKDVSRVQIVEVILRTIVTYNRLLADGVITYNELAYLLVGSQIEAFDISDAEDKVGDLGCHRKRDFDALIESGLFKKVYRKQKWYITVAGKDRLNEILRYIYENKIGTYKILKKLIVEV